MLRSTTYLTVISFCAENIRLEQRCANACPTSCAVQTFQLVFQGSGIGECAVRTRMSYIIPRTCNQDSRGYFLVRTYLWIAGSSLSAREVFFWQRPLTGPSLQNASVGSDSQGKKYVSHTQWTRVSITAWLLRFHLTFLKWFRLTVPQPWAMMLTRTRCSMLNTNWSKTSIGSGSCATRERQKPLNIERSPEA